MFIDAMKPPATASRSRIAHWIRRELDSAPPKAKSLVVTVWGDAIAPHGGRAWLSGLIRLLAPLGLNERLVRTSVYRLSGEGWLANRRNGRQSVYWLTPQGLRRFENAYRRIYAAPSDGWDGQWDVVLVPPAAIPATARRELRKELWWEGFGPLGPGLFVRPARRGESAILAATLRALGIQRHVTVIEGRDVAGTGGRTLRNFVRDCWDLDALASEYRAFIKRFVNVLAAFRDTPADPEQCFLVRTLLIHTFRRVTLHDPQLPLELLPPRWPAATAYGLCRDFYRLTHKRAEEHLAAMLESQQGRLPPAAAYFYQRFGGLQDI